jgi:Glycosyl transferase family 2
MIVKSAFTSLAKKALGRRQASVRELRNKVALGHTALASRRAEDAEVARLAGQLPPLPPARVATIIATYRRPELLARAVRSALAQTVRDQVVLVVDDAGGLPELPADPRLRACSLSANTGVAGVVRNVGIRLTRSTYVAFLDDDNEWEPHHLEMALAALEYGPADERPGLVYTAVQRCLPDGQSLDVLSTAFDRRLLARESFVDTNALVIRRSRSLYFSRLSRSREVRPIEDWELVYRLTRRQRAVHVPVPTVRYLVNPDSYWTDWTGVLAPGTPATGGPTDV